jgi:hypothetical protein
MTVLSYELIYVYRWHDYSGNCRPTPEKRKGRQIGSVTRAFWHNVFIVPGVGISSVKKCISMCEKYCIRSARNFMNLKEVPGGVERYCACREVMQQQNYSWHIYLQFLKGIGLEKGDEVVQDKRHEAVKTKSIKYDYVKDDNLFQYLYN